MYAGAVDLAGAVHARKGQSKTTSDFMAIERERGISITTTALQFDYEEHRLNLLDTPGHNDFSEDTYRTLMAVDCAIMVLDSARGVEAQTRKLFEVCRMRRIPILTFVNKMDHHGRDPFDTLDEVERVLGIAAAPMNWPIGIGLGFQGVYDLRDRRVLRFERNAHGQRRSAALVSDFNDPKLANELGEHAYGRLRDDVELLSGAGAMFDRERFLSGDLTPVFFGSALNNFGVEPFLQAILELAPPPAPRASDCGVVDPEKDAFTGFVFKIQANLDPQHRDRIAFVRVCSGRFRKDMAVHHSRLDRIVRLTRPYRFFGREREVVEEAYPGDVVGLVNPGLFTIGDTLSADKPRSFGAVPRFQPEHFAVLRSTDTTRYKQFHKGLEQLNEEGAIQVLHRLGGVRSEPILAAVGELQFEVVVARLKTEYGVVVTTTRLPYTVARWVGGDPKAVADLSWPYDTLLAEDGTGRIMVLFPSEWSLNYFMERNTSVVLDKLG